MSISKMIYVEIDERKLDELEEIAACNIGFSMIVDAATVSIMIKAYRERDRIKKELEEERKKIPLTKTERTIMMAGINSMYKNIKK